MDYIKGEVQFPERRRKEEELISDVSDDRNNEEADNQREEEQEHEEWQEQIATHGPEEYDFNETIYYQTGNETQSEEEQWGGAGYQRQVECDGDSDQSRELAECDPASQCEWNQIPSKI